MTAMKTIKSLVLAAAFALGVGSVAVPSAPVHAAGGGPTPTSQNWSFNGFFGTWDYASLQRGFQVYKEVCSSCHALSLVSYRHLEMIGFSEEEVAAIADDYWVTDGPDEWGDMFDRPAIPADRFASPFPNEEAARAANAGAYPVDLSVITQARHYGPDYLYAFIQGFRDDAPDDVVLRPGQYYNYYYGGAIAMPPMLWPDGVVYSDGTEATVQQQAWDITNFLMWTAEPHLQTRKQAGLGVMIFLIVLTAFMYAVKRKLWADVKH